MARPYLDRVDIARRYQAGERICSIARVHNCQPSAVHYVLQRVGVLEGSKSGTRGNMLARDRYLIKAGLIP